MLFATLKRVYGTEIYNNAEPECIQLLAKEEFEMGHRLEKMKLKVINSELTRKRFSSTINKIRTSLRISINKGTVYPQESFKDNDKTTTSNSNSDLNSKNKKKLFKMPQKGKGKGGINPMITILFLGMTFKAWKSFTNKKQEGFLLSNDSLPPNKNEESDDEEDFEEEESEENYDEFDENEQEEYENKALKPRRVGFANFGEIQEEDEENNESDENDEEEIKNEEFKNQNTSILSQRQSLNSASLSETKSILKARKFSEMSPQISDKRGSKFGSLLFTLTEKRNSRFTDMMGEEKSIHESEESGSSSSSSSSEKSKE